MKGMPHPSVRGPKMKAPTMPHITKPTTKIHPASMHNMVRLPQGIADVKGGDPGVYSPDIGKI